MAELGNGRKVFDLDSFAPAPLRFRLRSVEYEISGDPDVDLVAMMLRLEPLLQVAQGVSASDLTADLADSIEEAKAIVLDLIEERQPVDRDSFRIGAGDLLILFARITGGESVAEEVARALTSAQADENGNGADGEKATGGAADGEDGAAATPTRSARRSSARSSRSASRAAGRRTITGA